MTIEFIYEEISVLIHSEKFYGGWAETIIAASSRSRSLRDLK